MFRKPERTPRSESPTCGPYRGAVVLRDIEGEDVIRRFREKKQIRRTLRLVDENKG